MVNTKQAEGLYVDADEIRRAGAVPRALRIRGMLDAQAFWFGIQRARLARRFPRLTERERVLEMFEELEQSDGLV